MLMIFVDIYIKVSVAGSAICPTIYTLFSLCSRNWKYVYENLTQRLYFPTSFAARCSHVAKFWSIPAEAAVGLIGQGLHMSQVLWEAITCVGVRSRESLCLGHNIGTWGPKWPFSNLKNIWQHSSKFIVTCILIPSPPHTPHLTSKKAIFHWTIINWTRDVCQVLF